MGNGVDFHEFDFNVMMNDFAWSATGVEKGRGA
jgi:hypothetical protein